MSANYKKKVRIHPCFSHIRGSIRLHIGLGTSHNQQAAGPLTVCIAERWGKITQRDGSVPKSSTLFTCRVAFYDSCMKNSSSVTSI